MNRHFKTLLAPVAAVALTLSLAACGSDDDSSGSDVTVAEAWVRQPAEGQTTSAAYGVITNDGDETITLVGGAVEFDATIEVHETMMDDEGVMMMQEREGGFEIAAGDTFTLEPGGPHVMMLDIDPADITDPVAVTYIFDDGTEVTVDAEVRALDMDMDHDMDDGEMDMDDDMDDMDDDMDDSESDG